MNLPVPIYFMKQPVQITDNLILTHLNPLTWCIFIFWIPECLTGKYVRKHYLALLNELLSCMFNNQTINKWAKVPEDPLPGKPGWWTDFTLKSATKDQKKRVLKFEAPQRAPWMTWRNNISAAIRMWSFLVNTRMRSGSPTPDAADSPISVYPLPIMTGRSEG